MVTHVSGMAGVVGNRAQRRKNRCLSATDSEWQAITDMAHAAGMPISRFVVQMILTPAATIAQNSTQSTLPETAQWDQIRAVLTLMQIAEENMTKRGDANCNAANHCRTSALVM
jgi:hypothetical protein